MAHRPVLGITLVVREEIADLASALVTAWHKEVERLDPAQCWSYACRAIRGSTSPSNHSWGLALDLNSAKHPLGKRGTFTAGQVRAIHTLLGRPPFRHWKWGGDYLDRADEMHVEYLGTPAEAAADTLRLNETGDDAMTPEDKAYFDSRFTAIDKRIGAVEKGLGTILGNPGDTDADPTHGSIGDAIRLLKEIKAAVGSPGGDASGEYTMTVVRKT